MRQYLCAALVTAMASLATASASDYKILPLEELTTVEVEQFLEEISDENVIEISEGLSLPLQLFMDGDLLKLREEDEYGAVQVGRTFFMRHDPAGFQFSLDLASWYSFEQFVTGELRVEINVDGDAPTLRLGCDLNAREG